MHPLPPALDDALLFCLASKVLSETPADTLQCETWLQERIKEWDHDFAVIDRNYLNQLRIHLHLDDKNRIRLIRINAPQPIDSFYSKLENSNDVPVAVSTYWLDAWSGPKEVPIPLPKANDELQFKVQLSSCREYLWANFDGILLLDLTKLSNNAADVKTKALFNPEVQFVRCMFESGYFNGRNFQFTVIVQDTWTLKEPDESKLANIPQRGFCSALFLGDRLVELGTDNCCVVIYIARRLSKEVGVDPTQFSWICTLAWDDKRRVNDNVTLNDIENRFMLVSDSLPNIKILDCRKITFLCYLAMYLSVVSCEY